MQRFENQKLLKVAIQVHGSKLGLVGGQLTRTYRTYDDVRMGRVVDVSTVVQVHVPWMNANRYSLHWFVFKPPLEQTTIVHTHT